MRSLIRAAYRFRDAALIAEKKDAFGGALQNPYRELEHAEELVGPHGDFQFRLASQKGQSNEIRIL
jgi:hypothetical protein